MSPLSLVVPQVTVSEPEPDRHRFDELCAALGPAWIDAAVRATGTATLHHRAPHQGGADSRDACRPAHSHPARRSRRRVLARVATAPAPSVPSEGLMPRPRRLRC